MSKKLGFALGAGGSRGVAHIGFLKAMEENGIGRPSTYAPILSNILSRDYIEREKKSLKPTNLGMVVSDLMVEYFNKIFDVKLIKRVRHSIFAWRF